MALGGGGEAVGLDIGASAVRLAQLSGGRGGTSLTNFAQVALPQGAVTDGEIRDVGAVSEAISQLWKRSKVRSKNVIVGVANQRVVVRQVDLPFLEEKEFRSSLRFQAADYIPMSVEDAELDFVMLDDYTTENQEHMMRVLLIAAATDMVEGFVSAAQGGGANVVGVDLIPFAVARATSAAARGETGLGGSEAIVDVGAGTTNILVHLNGQPRFVRILLVGGDDVTNAIAEGLGIEAEEAEAVKLDLGRGVGPEQSQAILARQVDAIVDEIRGSLDYYLSQEDSEPVTSIVMTGGGSLMSGLVQRLEQTLRTTITVGQPLAGVNTSRSGLAQDQIDQIQPVAATAVGLALGGLNR